MKHYKRTKIIATLGPSICSKIWDMKMYNDPKNKELVSGAHERMSQIFKLGVTTCRLNFSHGNHEEQLVRIKIAREEAKKLNLNISIMLDTKGPEIRIGEMKPGEESFVKMGSTVMVHCNDKIVGDKNQFSVTDSTGKYDMSKDLDVGKTVLVDDGKLPLIIEKIDRKKGIITTKAVTNHQLITNKRINLPGTTYNIPFLSEKDINDVKFACDHKLDYIAMSFVNNANDVKLIRELTEKYGHPNIQLISKIESNNGIDNIDEIIEASDGIMVARGDLGLEVPYYDIPYWEKYIIKACRFKGKPVIVATQMLDSLEKQTNPTRAEVTDVYFAVDRGADATMLSGETANGQFPVRAVEVMSMINLRAEDLFDYERSLEYYFLQTDLSKRVYGDLVSSLARRVLPIKDGIKSTSKFDYIVSFTKKHRHVKTLAASRPAATCIIVTDDDEIANGYGIYYGIQTYKVNDLEKAKKEWKKIALDAVGHFPKNVGKALVLNDLDVHYLQF